MAPFLSWIQYSLVLLVIIWSSNGADDSKYVRIRLDSKWANTPILLEASEFIAAENRASFWKFVEGTLDAYTKKTDQDVYNYILDAASQILSPLEVDLLKLSLSSRAFSPKIELFRQIGKELNLPDCDLVFSFKDNFYCNIEDLLVKMAKSNSARLKFGYSFDHIYPESNNNPITVILYGQMGTEPFAIAHQTLSDLSRQNRVKYILRHYVKEGSDEKVRLSGYGVELAIKSTEYKAVDDQKVDEKEHASQMGHGTDDQEDEVDGFLFGPLRQSFPELKAELDQFRNHLKESNKELAPLKVWQLQDLSLQAAQRVMSSSPSEALRVLRDISQNLPMIARSLVKTTVKDEMKKEIKDNQKEFEKFDISPGDSSLFINGLQLQLEALDPYMLSKLLKDESVTLKKLDELGLEGDAANDLVTLNTKSSEERHALDIRSTNVQWMNDLEKDPQYSYWPSNLEEILRPTFPGMLRYIAKNIFHIVVCIDPTDPKGIQLFQTIREYVTNSMPARFGVLFIANGDPKDDGRTNIGAGIVRAFQFIKADKDTSQAVEFVSQLYQMSGGAAPEKSDFEERFRRLYGQDELNDALGPNSEYDDLRKNSVAFFQKTGLRELPSVLVNGVPLSSDEINHLESSLVEKMLTQTQEIQNAVFLGHVQRHSSVYDFVMTQGHVVKRLNSLIQKSDGEYITIGNEPVDIWTKDIDKFKSLEPRKMLSALNGRVKYFLGDKGAVTLWVIADANTESGRGLLQSALTYLVSNPNSKSQKLGNANARVAIIVHEDGTDHDPTNLTTNRIIQIILQLREKLVSGVAKLVSKIVNEARNLDNMADKIDTIVDLAKGITGINKNKLREVLSTEEKIKEASAILEIHSVIIKEALKMPSCQAAVISNGRILGPLFQHDVFTVEDFKLLHSYEADKSASKIDELVEKMELTSLPPDGHERYKSDLVMKVNAILSEREQRTRQIMNFKGDKHSVVHLKPMKPGVSYDVVAILDPLTAESQKLVPMLMALYNITNVNLKVFMNCKEKLSEMPLKRFYRYVLEPQLAFDADGKLFNAQQALFMGMPQSAILTLNMDTPQSWMVEAVRSPFDLDNIHLAQVEQGVFGDFELEYILVEGHCADAISGSPPRGLQFNLGTTKDPERFDTIVMANLGYFQLKGSPGNFILQLRKGRSAEIYDIDSVVGGDKNTYQGNFSITVDSFSGKFLKVKVQRKPGKEREDLLSDGKTEENHGLWDSFTSYVSGDKSDGRSGDTIHIFSVATGLLYERMLRIMMLSVMKNTKSKVKFWFLKNYLSPTFTSFLPHMAKEYKFEFELVQYQWPRWLNRQRDKQRIIWGYKILFLDVLFPLNVGRVIFVDADQVVRTDLKELMEMDLGGAPYAYTPFCSDRTEMDGFRFWNQGYWKSHLGGRPYHISALYVVDLRTFRRIAAGDRLRGQYQGLSQDPNSLANLDQDLPNNMIHQVPIKSLPQEWLWCETWCSDYSKKYAKTIDLCNNPLTKEPKLDRAVRIVEEWPRLDEEIKSLQEKVAKNKTSTRTQEGFSKKQEL